MVSNWTSCTNLFNNTTRLTHTVATTKGQDTHCECTALKIRAQTSISSSNIVTANWCALAQLAAPQGDGRSVSLSI